MRGHWALPAAPPAGPRSASAAPAPQCRPQTQQSAPSPRPATISPHLASNRLLRQHKRLASEPLPSPVSLSLVLAYRAPSHSLSPHLHPTRNTRNSSSSSSYSPTRKHPQRIRLGRAGGCMLQAVARRWRPCGCRECWHGLGCRHRRPCKHRKKSRKEGACAAQRRKERVMAGGVQTGADTYAHRAG